MISAHRYADRLCGGPAEEALGRTVPGKDHPVPVERDEGIRRAVENEPGASRSPERVRPTIGVEGLGPDTSQ